MGRSRKERARLIRAHWTRATTVPAARLQARLTGLAAHASGVRPPVAAPARLRGLCGRRRRRILTFYRSTPPAAGSQRPTQHPRRALAPAPLARMEEERLRDEGRRQVDHPRPRTPSPLRAPALGSAAGALRSALGRRGHLAACRPPRARRAARPVRSLAFRRRGGDVSWRACGIVLPERRAGNERPRRRTAAGDHGGEVRRRPASATVRRGPWSAGPRRLLPIRSPRPLQ